MDAQLICHCFRAEEDTEFRQARAAALIAESYAFLGKGAKPSKPGTPGRQ